MNTLIDAVKKSAVGPAQKKDPGAITGRYCFSEDFLGFSGHFPGYPIVPAVVQLMSALCLIEEQKGRRLQLDSVRNAKFLQEIRPGNEITIQCMDYPIQGMTGSKIQIFSGGKVSASFLMTFSDKGETMC